MTPGILFTSVGVIAVGVITLAIVWAMQVYEKRQFHD